jgi:integrase
MTTDAPNLGLKYVTFDKTNGFYVYQREVPQDAVWLVQRKKITNSLGRDPVAAQTKYHSQIHPKWEKAISDAVERLHRDPDMDAFMDRAVLFINAMMAEHGGQLPDSELAADLHNWAARDQLWEKWENWNLAHDGTKVRDILHEDSWEDLNQLATTWETFRAAHRRRIGLSAQLPSKLVNSNTPTEDGQIVMSLTDLEDRWLKEKDRSHAVKADMKRMVSLFVALNGNLPIHQITASHRLKFRDAVQAIPDIKAQTQNKLMRTLAALGQLAEKIGAVTSNPIRTFAFEVTDEIIREAFEDTHLKQVFESNAWKARSPKYREFIFWYFRIGAYTGARIGEIAQLRTEDVFERDGEWVFRFTYDDEETEDARQSKTKQVKIVPVADQLIKWGLLELVESRKGGQLFPEVTPDTKGNWSGKVSPPVSRVLRGAGLPEEFVGHSWRHTLIERLRGKAEDSIVQMITHPPKSKRSVWSRYGRAQIVTMKKAVNLLDYNVKWPALAA